MKRNEKMVPETLRAARKQRNWTETEAARRLGMSQSYVAMLERGQRKLTPRLTRRFKALYGLRPTMLPMSDVFEPHAATSEALAKEVSALGYPGFAYLKSGLREKNPAEVLLGALAQENLEPRVMEALPWLLLQYWDMDFGWLVAKAKLNDLQNRLGFVVSLAKRVSERRPSHTNEEQRQALAHLGKMLENSRLAREDTFLRRLTTDVEREWLRQNRSEDARHWNLLTNWRPEHLPYAS